MDTVGGLELSSAFIPLSKALCIFHIYIYIYRGIPYQALGYELVGETFHRTKLYTLEKIIENIGLLFAAGLPSVFLVFMNVKYIYVKYISRNVTVIMPKLMRRSTRNV